MGFLSGIFGGGGSNTQIVIPEGEAPRAFQTVIPQKSYKDLAESMNRTEKEYNRVLDQRYDMVGTGAALGAKQSLFIVQALDSSGPEVKKVSSSNKL